MPTPTRVDINTFFSQGVAEPIADWEVRSTRKHGSYAVATVTWREPGYRLPEEDPLTLFVHVNGGALDPLEAAGISGAIQQALEWKRQHDTECPRHTDLPEGGA